MAPLNWSTSCRRVTTHFVYLTPDSSFGVLLSLQTTPRGRMPSKSTIPTSPENPPVVGRRHSVVFIPETPLCFHRFFLGFFLYSKSRSGNHGSYTHSARQIAVKKQHSQKRRANQLVSISKYRPLVGTQHHSVTHRLEARRRYLRSFLGVFFKIVLVTVCGLHPRFNTLPMRHRCRGPTAFCRL